MVFIQRLNIQVETLRNIFECLIINISITVELIIVIITFINIIGNSKINFNFEKFNFKVKINI